MTTEEEAWIKFFSEDFEEPQILVTYTSLDLTANPDLPRQGSYSPSDLTLATVKQIQGLELDHSRPSELPGASPLLWEKDIDYNRLLDQEYDSRGKNQGLTTRLQRFMQDRGVKTVGDVVDLFQWTSRKDFEVRDGVPMPRNRPKGVGPLSFALLYDDFGAQRIDLVPDDLYY